jgi:hypothetical protein
MNKRPCKNCGMLEKDHQNKDKHYPGLCKFDHLSLVMQEEINMGNIIPDTDWDWISYQPIDNLAWLEWKSEQSNTL